MTASLPMIALVYLGVVASSLARFQADEYARWKTVVETGKITLG
jgi:hypothetical protein